MLYSFEIGLQYDDNAFGWLSYRFTLRLQNHGRDQHETGAEKEFASYRDYRLLGRSQDFVHIALNSPES